MEEKPKPRKLLDRVRDRIRLKHYSYRTEQSYVNWIKRYILFHGKRHPADMGVAEVQAFLTHLAVKGQVAASTQNQALCAILFLYRDVLEQELPAGFDFLGASKPKRLPVVLTRSEAQAVIGLLKGPHQLAVKLLYGSGLRVVECLRLRVKDLDFELCTITVRDGKGDQDRITVLPDGAVTALGEQLERVRAIHNNRDRGLPALAGRGMSLSPFSKLLLTPTNIRAKVNLCKPNERGTRSTISSTTWCGVPRIAAHS